MFDDVLNPYFCTCNVFLQNKVLIEQCHLHWTEIKSVQIHVLSRDFPWCWITSQHRSWIWPWAAWVSRRSSTRRWAQRVSGLQAGQPSPGTHPNSGTAGTVHRKERMLCTFWRIQHCFKMFQQIFTFGCIERLRAQRISDYQLQGRGARPQSTFFFQNLTYFRESSFFALLDHLGELHGTRGDILGFERWHDWVEQ